MLDESMINPFGDINLTLPASDLDKISKVVTETYDHISAIYSQKHFDDFVLNHPLDGFIRRLKQQNEHNVAHILDIGCGPGLEARYLSTRGFTVIGIDASRKMIHLAKQTTSKKKSCKFIRMKMQDLQFPEASFDAIWCSRALIHVPQTLVVDLLVSWKHVLKPEGILGISVIIGQRNGWGPEDYDQKYLMFNRYFSEGEIEAALENAGFSILDRSTTIDHRDPDNPMNLFLLAQKLSTRVDLPQEDEGDQNNHPAHLEQVIAAHLRAGVLTPRDQVNLCVLYDHLAKREKANLEQYKLAAQKLKLHLQTPDTLSSDDFEVWFTFGQLHLKLTQFQQAVDCLKKARQLRPDNIPTLMRLSFSYEGLHAFDRAINTAHEIEHYIESSDADDETRAELYHALGHFYVGRSHIRFKGVSISDRETGEHYMERACSTGKKGVEYLGCLGSVYNEAKRYTETIKLLTDAIHVKQLYENEELHNELYFYRGEAFMGAERYENARADFERVESYAHEKQDWDSVALVRLYQTRMNLKRKNVNELQLDDISNYLDNLLEYEPSPYMIKSFQRDRERLISILNAFYRLKECLDEQQPPKDFYIRLSIAIEYMERVYVGDQKPKLDWLVLADNPGKVRGEITTFSGSPCIYSFDEVTERDIGQFRVWGVLALGKEEEEQDPHSLARVSFLIGRFYREGHIIYIYDPKQVFPETIHTALEHFFVDSIDDLKTLSYACLLYNEVREYVNSTITPLGMAPLGVTPSLLAAQSENITLLPTEEGGSI